MPYPAAGRPARHRRVGRRSPYPCGWTLDREGGDAARPRPPGPAHRPSAATFTWQGGAEDVVRRGIVRPPGAGRRYDLRLMGVVSTMREAGGVDDGGSRAGQDADTSREGGPGRVGPYVLERLLGEGGMGHVYLARRADAPARAPVALKVVRPELARDSEFLARFRREVAAARAVTSPCVVPLLDSDADADVPWLAMAFVPGPSLEDAVRGTGALSEDRLRELARVLAAALADIHAAGLVHRDLKPSNVLLHPDRGPQVIDLGIARAMDGTRLTATGLVIGTPGFMAPDQYLGGDPQPASDVFALGAILAYAATGRPPFGDGPHHRIGYRTMTEEPDLDGVPAGLLPLVAACLAKDPTARPDPAAIQRALAGRRLPSDSALAALLSRLSRRPVSRRRVLITRGGLALTVVAGLVGGAFALLGTGGGPGTGSGARPVPKSPAPAKPAGLPLPAPISALGPAAPAGPWTRTWQDTTILQDHNRAEYERVTKDGNDYAVEAWLTDKILVRVGRQAVQGLSTDTGKALWTLQPPEPGLVPCQASRTAPGGVGAVTFAEPAARGAQGTGRCDRVVAVELATGRARWARPHPGGETYSSANPRSIAVAAGHVIVHNGDYVGALRLTDGSLAWSHRGRDQKCAVDDATAGQFTLVETLTCPFDESGGRTRPTTVRSIDAADGTVRWTSRIPGDIPAEQVESAEPAVVSLPGGIGVMGGPLMVFDGTGRPGPHLRAAQPFGRLDDVRNDYQLTPTVFGWRETVYTVSQRDQDRRIMQRRIVAVDSRTGTIRWHVPVPAGSKPVIAGVDDRGVHVVHVTAPGTSALVRYALADGRAEELGTLPALPEGAEFDGARLHGDRLALMTGVHNLLTKGVMMFRSSGSRS
ncbi:protein kinase [Streptomyces lateritius]|uniref:Protein kinase n=1 Tax=Streptomyces lateritius TaxID=67313 RepID=A0ABW6YGC2_9ACTN